MINVEMITSKTSIAVDNKQIRKKIIFIRIENKLSSAYMKVITPFDHHIFPPIIKMRQLSIIS